MEIKYKYTLRSGKSGLKTAIQSHFNYPNGRFRYPLGEKILFDVWDEKTQRPTNDIKLVQRLSKIYPTIKNDIANVNSKINNLESHTDTWKSLKIQAKESLDLDDLKKYLDQNFKKKEPKIKTAEYSLNLEDMIQSFLDGITKGKILYKGNRYKEGTIKVYTTLKNSFSDIQEHYKTKYTIEDINKDLASKWTQYLYEVKNSSKSNVGKQHKHFKKVINYHLEEIRKEDYKNQKNGIAPILTINQRGHIESGLKYFVYYQSSKTNIALTEKELKSLFELGEDKLAKHYIPYRDVFLVGCYSALRYSDYKRIGPEHVKGNNIVITTEKNPTGVIIPIRPELKFILDKYDNKMPKTYEQKMNKYIKTICQIAEINDVEPITENVRGEDITGLKPRYKLVSTHTARRTAATLMYNSGIHYKDIMNITGHSSIASFERYLKLDKKESLERMRKSTFFIGNSLSVVKN